MIITMIYRNLFSRRYPSIQHSTCTVQFINVYFHISYIAVELHVQSSLRSYQGAMCFHLQKNLEFVQLPVGQRRPFVAYMLSF